MKATPVAIALGMVWLAAPAIADDRDGLHSSVCGAGDLDGDGIEDFVLASRDSGGPETVWALSGKEGKFLWGLRTDLPGDAFGGALASAGDVDGDGTAELLIGAPGRTCVQDGSSISTREVGAGRAILVSGKSGRVLRILRAVHSSEAFGTSVAGSADLDGDRIPDLLVGSPRADPPRVCAFSGRTGEVLREFFAGEDDVGSCRLGESVCEIGDLDCDDYPEVAAGDTGARRPLLDFAGGLLRPPRSRRTRGIRESGVRQGCVRILSGRTGELLATIWDEPTNGELGWVIERVADFDGDEGRDFCITSTDGIVRVLSSRTSRDLLRVQYKGSVLISFGSSVASVEYREAGRRPDLAIGANESSIDYFNWGCMRLVSGIDGSFLGQGYYSETNGVDVASPGDLDGDGTTDLVLSCVGPREFGRAGAVGQELLVLSSRSGTPWYSVSTDDLRSFPTRTIGEDERTR